MLCDNAISKLKEEDLISGSMLRQKANDLGQIMGVHFD